jgi:hypothetical protein
MKVLIGGHIYDSEKTPILVEFDEQEQDLFGPYGMKRFVSAPADSTVEERQALIDTDLKALYLTSKKVGEVVHFNFNACTRKGKIEKIEVVPGTDRVIFHLVSPYGNHFRLTQEEMQFHEVSR